ncbi:hypothetical protein WJ40_08685 [Burkholderia cepacia]|nr:hypothetical protein WJ40_08685 [Burkholderia cepacia]KVQ29319.1 hypothetical protein WK01_14565 [Burkholderia cepacia]
MRLRKLTADVVAIARMTAVAALLFDRAAHAVIDDICRDLPVLTVVNPFHKVTRRVVFAGLPTAIKSDLLDQP